MSKQNEIKALYFHKHTPKSIPARGKLSLSTAHLSFEGSRGRHQIELQLTKIRIEKFKGRFYSGVKVIESSSGGEYIFTKVSNDWFERIQDAIDAACVRHELEVSVKPRLKEFAREVDFDGEQQGSSFVATFMIPFTVLFAFIFKAILMASKKITGRNFLLPNNMDDGIHNVEVLLPQILAVSEINQPKAVHVAIRNELEHVTEHLERLKSIVGRRRRLSSSAGSVEDRENEATLSKIHPIEILFSFKALVKRIVDLFFFVIWKFNVPLLRRDQFILRKHPTTVAEAVRNVNYKINDLMELANESNSETMVVGEIKKIQEGLFNTKMLSLTMSSPSNSKDS